MHERLAFRVASILLATLPFSVPCFSQASSPYTEGVPVLTQHNDNWRTGAFLNEKRITVASLGAQGMRLIVPPIDVGDDIETQVLYVPRVPMHTFNGASLTNVAIVT